MSITLILFLAAFVIMSVMTFMRPIWGMGVYMLVFFAFPPYWWWGVSLPYFRWSLYGGLLFLAGVLVTGAWKSEFGVKARQMRYVGYGLIINATFVHFALAPRPITSYNPYILSVKITVLFLVMIAAIRSRQDFQIAFLILTLGVGYWGYEATINDRGSYEDGRLERLGGPGAKNSNQTSSCVATIMPIVGCLIFTAAHKWVRILALLLAPLVLNVVLLCKSRGAFLAMIAAAVVFQVTARGKLRRKVFTALCLGSVVCYMLLNDPTIVDRFMTTFVSNEERDASASTRLLLWEAGLLMIRDHPIGTGGNGFKRVRGAHYMREVGLYESDGERSVHNGHINEACEWGLQGLALRWGLYLLGGLLAYRTMEFCRSRNDLTSAFYGSCILASLTAFLVSSTFSDVLDAEWGIWVAALAIGYSRVYGPDSPENLPLEQPAEVPRQQAQQLEMAGV